MSSVIIIGQWWEVIKSIWTLFALFIWGKEKNPDLHNDELRNRAHDYSGSSGKDIISQCLPLMIPQYRNGPQRTPGKFKQVTFPNK